MTKRSPIFRNSDERLRQLEREAAATGSPDAVVRLLVERIRTGVIRLDDLAGVSDDDLALIVEFVPHGREAAGREQARRMPPLPVVIRAWDSEERRRTRTGEGARLWVRPYSTRPLDLGRAEAVLRVAGARIAPRSTEWGQSNRPEVTVFSGLESRRAENLLRDAGLDVAGVLPKTWGGDAAAEHRISPDLMLLFPTEPCAPPDDCVYFSWEHTGHGWARDYGCADYQNIVSGTRAATPEEYAPAVAAYEAENGRRLRVYARARWEFHDQRRMSMRGPRGAP